jgi:molecular chaperone HscA
MLETTNRFIEKNRALLSDEEIATTRAHMNELGVAIASKDKDRIQHATEQLNDISRPFAERVMDAALKEAMRGKKVL